MDLCDFIDASIKYYCYLEIKLRIESPGGLVQALNHTLHKLSGLHDGIIIRTEGFALVASAAAVLLSMGTAGYRTCYRTCKLCYHGARVKIDGAITKERAEEMLYQLKENDEIIIAQLLDKAVESLSHTFEQRIRNNNIYLALTGKNDEKKRATNAVSRYQKEYRKLAFHYDEIIEKGLDDKKAVPALRRYLRTVYQKLYADDIFIDSYDAQFLLLVDEII